MPSIFISHNHKDKPFSKRLADDLRKHNIRVWIDEAEIKIGDSLIEKIRQGIDEMEYVGVVISHNSISSSWVKKEVDIAMNQEIEGNKVKVLPLLIDDVDLPSFLKGKLYADFRSDLSYEKEFKKLLERLAPFEKQNLQETEIKTYNILRQGLREQPINSLNPISMKDALKNRSDFDIDFYQMFIASLFQTKNRNKTIYELVFNLNLEIDELIRVLTSVSAREEVFIRSVTWLFSLSSQMDFVLQDSFFKTYPGICPYCLERKCVCYKTGKKPIKAIPAYKIEEEMFFKYEAIRNHDEIPNFNFAAKMISDIYSAQEAIFYSEGPKYLGNGIQKKITGLTRTMKNYLDGNTHILAIADDVSHVFADVMFSWNLILPDQSIDDQFIEYYLDGCPVCKTSPCQC